MSALKPINDEHKRILHVVATDGPINPGQIGRVLRMRPSTVNSMLVVLWKRGLVERANRAGYTNRSFVATEAGEEAAV